MYRAKRIGTQNESRGSSKLGTTGRIQNVVKEAARIIDQSKWTRQCRMWDAILISPLPRNGIGWEWLIMPVMEESPGKGETTICTSLMVSQRWLWNIAALGGWAHCIPEANGTGELTGGVNVLRGNAALLVAACRARYAPSTRREEFRNGGLGPNKPLNTRLSDCRYMIISSQ